MGPQKTAAVAAARPGSAAETLLWRGFQRFARGAVADPIWTFCVNLLAKRQARKRPGRIASRPVS
jgi:hypothetical protein